MRLLQGVVAGCLCLIVLIAGCRRNQPTLVDTNEAPETELWYSPPDSSEYQYLVHLYWRGTDNDGTVERYIWTIQDSLNVGETAWNPAQRLRDLRSGHITSATDSVFAFTAFKNVAGVGIRKNRQAFYMASIDDNGVIDPSPAAVEFIATIDKLPTIDFTVHINGKTNPYSSDRTELADTVGMYRPFSISFHGETVNGLKKDPDTGEIVDDGIRAYTWFPLSTSISLPGSGMWRPWTSCEGLEEDSPERAQCEQRALQDTMVTLRNRDEDVIPSSTFRFAAQCRDDADAESPIDAARYREGVCQVVVNFDPDTEIDQVKSTYWIDDVKHERDVDFTDAIPDTVPYLSWLWIHYAAWDDSRDSTLCKDDINPDHCIDFQLSYERRSARLPGSGGGSGWVPRGATHDTDTTSAADSNTVNIGTVEYTFFVRGIDENSKPDGTPARVAIVGNYDPTLDNVTLEDQFGNQLDLATTDTLTWNFWKGVGWPYSSPTDTIDFTRPSRPFKKTFRWRLRATGHDNPLDPTGSGVKAWRYLIFDEAGNFWPLLRAGETWVTNDGLNNLDDTYEITWRYGSWNLEDSLVVDPYGDTVMNNLPGFVNRDLTVYVRGRDTAVEEPDFKQYMFLGIVPPGQKGVHNFADKVLLNTYPTAVFGRWTQEKVFTFHWRMVRDPAPPPTR